MGYKLAGDIDSALTNLTTTYPALCDKIALTTTSVQGKPITGVHIANGSGGRTPVLFTGGVHAREWAPPDALVSFASNLLQSFSNSTDIVYPAFTDNSAVPPITYSSPNYTVTAGQVNAILPKFDLYIVPIVNPDGRDFSLSGGSPPNPLNMTWRKNKRPSPAGFASPDCDGIDLNRNFPIAWDHELYYTSAAALKANVSKNPCDETYRGPLPASEPETQGVVALLASLGITYFVDVHMFGRTILYPWGLETDQTNDSTQNFLNPAWNHDPITNTGGRDGLLGSAYGEFLPDDLVSSSGQMQTRLIELADAMAAEMSASAGSDPRAQARSTYTPQPSVGLYPTTGAVDDYTFSQQFVNPALPNIHAFTVECGFKPNKTTVATDDDDGGFWPDFVNKYPKIEREVHAALFGLLKAI